MLYYCAEIKRYWIPTIHVEHVNSGRWELWLCHLAEPHKTVLECISILRSPKEAGNQTPPKHCHQNGSRTPKYLHQNSIKTQRPEHHKNTKTPECQTTESPQVCHSKSVLLRLSYQSVIARASNQDRLTRRSQQECLWRAPYKTFL